jgi:hypothetical protein
MLGNYNCPNYIIHLKKEVNSSRDNSITIYHNEKNIIKLNTYNIIKPENIFEYKSNEDCNEDNINLRIFYNCENLKYFNNESIDILKVNFNNKNQLSNNINNYIKKKETKKEEYNLIINYKNLLEHIFIYKNYYYILSTLILLYAI